MHKHVICIIMDDRYPSYFHIVDSTQVICWGKLFSPKKLMWLVATTTSYIYTYTHRIQYSLPYSREEMLLAWEILRAGVSVGFLNCKGKIIRIAYLRTGFWVSSKGLQGDEGKMQWAGHEPTTTSSAAAHLFTSVCFLFVFLTSLLK